MPDAISALGTQNTTTLAAARQTDQAKSGPAQEMNQEVFLTLLVAQLQNQDPSSPMDTNQMVSQAAQLAQTETLNGIAASMQTQGVASGMSTSASLIGKDIDWATTEGVGNGRVTGAVFQNGQALLELADGTTVPLQNVTSINSINSDQPTT